MIPILQLQNLTTGYSTQKVLCNISIDIYSGETILIIGQNGCGKSTLLKTIARIISDNAGMINFAGMNLQTKKTSDLRNLGLSLFPQGGIVLETMLVREHFDLICRGYSNKKRTELTEKCYHYFPSLRNWDNLRGGNLSGGQRQTLSFALLLMQDTKCWLLDEPFAGLSPSSISDSVDFIAKIQKDEKKTILIVEHNYEKSFAIADRVAIIKDGSIGGIYDKKEFEEKDFINNKLYNN